MTVRHLSLVLVSALACIGARAQTPDLRWIRGGHVDSITAVAVSQDLTRVASAAKDGTVKIWSYSTGELVEVIRFGSAGPNSVSVPIDGLSLSADGGTVAVFPRVGGGLVRDLGSGAEWRIPTQDATTSCVSVSRDGRYVAFLLRTLACIWDRQTEQVTPVDDADALRFIGDGDTLMLFFGSSIVRYDPSTGNVVSRSFVDGGIPETRILSPDGRLFAAIPTNQRRIIVGSTIDSEARDSIGIDLENLTGTFTEDSRGILVTSNLTPRLSIGLVRINIDGSALSLEEPDLRASGHGGGGLAGGSVDGYHFFAGSSAGLGRVRFDATSMSDTLTSHRSSITTLATLALDTAVLTRSSGQWQVWKAATGQRVRGPFDSRLAVHTTKRGPLADVAVDSSRRSVVELLSGDSVGSLPVGGIVTSFSDDGERVLLTTSDSASVVDARTGAVIRRIRATWKRFTHGGFVEASLSATGLWIATRSSNLMTDPIILIGPNLKVDSLSSPGVLWFAGFSPDEKEFLARGYDSAIIVVNLADMSTRKFDLGRRIWSVRFAGNDRVVTVNDAGDVSIWSRTFERIATLPKMQAEVTGIAPSRDGRWLSVALADGTLLLFDVAGTGSASLGDMRALGSPIRVGLNGHGLKIDRIADGTVNLTLADVRGSVLARRQMNALEYSEEIEIPESIRSQAVFLHVSWSGGAYTHLVPVGR